jgi:hypothetical protein
MQLNRTLIITGPARVTFAGQTFWSKGDITVKPAFAKFDIATSSFGKVDSRYSSKQLEVSFEPDGRFTSALAAVLWPYASTSIGASIYGGSDRELLIQGRDGVQLSLPNASLTEMPSIRLGVGQTIQGSVKFVGLLKNNTDPGAAGAYYAISSVAYPGDTGWATSDIKTLAYDVAWGADAPWSSFLTEGGWEIGFGLDLSPQTVDGLGVIDMRLQGLEVTAQAIPVGPVMADVLAKMGNLQALGSSIAAQGANLNISATGLYLRVANASITDTDFRWGAEAKRLGQTTWMATRTVTAGALDPLFYVGTEAPA